MHLRISFTWTQISWFQELQIKSYGCLKFLGEVWVGRACVGANEKGLTTCAQKKELEFEKKGGSAQKKGLAPRPAPDRWLPTSGWPGIVDPQSGAQSRPVTNGRPSATTRALKDYKTPNFCKKKNYFFFGEFGKWARAFGRMGVQCPHFLKLGHTLGSAKCSIPHGDWRFHFFSNFIFAKFRVHLGLHIYYYDFCFMKNWDH
jgi:hypothetical protein